LRNAANNKKPTLSNAGFLTLQGITWPLLAQALGPAPESYLQK
jgi:hypothetical protein